jgi:arylsulfatase
VETKPKRPPNIVLILSDDMGYSDLGCFGGEISTPQLDTLAYNGLRFTQFYNTARCCPTRASLLTGLYPHQAGVGHMMDDRGHDGYRGALNNRCVTIAEVLKPAGYRTYALGKWHVSRHTSPDGDKSNWPLQRGFEKYYGTITGAVNFFDPCLLCRQNTYVTPWTDPEYKPESYYFTDAISDNAVAFLDQHQQESPDKPFFMYVAYTAAHWPMHARDSDIVKYQSFYGDGYDIVRRARFERMKTLGLVSESWSFPATPGDWEQQPHKAWESRCMQVYAAMVDSMDQGIARIVRKLLEQRQLDNTLILYLQDNGGCAEEVGREAMPADSPQKYPTIANDVILKEIRPIQTRAGLPVRKGPQVMPGPEDTYIAYGRNWANVSNTPFREFKHWVHEGGISTPLIAHWPAGIPAQRNGQLEKQPGHLVDILATCVAVSGADYPQERDGQAIYPRQGVSLLPAFQGQQLARTEPLFWEHEGNRALREGDWKIVAKEGQAWELYNLATDRTEQQNLAESEPARLEALAMRWEIMAKERNVLPLGTWKGKGQGTAGARKQRSSSR